jgi:alkylation response protein AidB-like acyl-CoA dehydrogenase
MPLSDGSNSGGEDRAILDAVERFLEREVRPHARALEAADEYPRELADRLAALGLYGATISPQYGGLGLTATLYTQIIERIAAVWMSLCGLFNSHLIAAAAVERFGTAEQKQRLLPRLASGSLRAGIALTEPGCGTDLQAVRTRAERSGDQYVVNGAKMWITNSVEGDALAVLVKTDPSAEPAHRGMSLLFIEKAMGFRASKLKKLGYRGIDTGEVSFRDVKVPAGNLIGGVEGKGLQQILAGLELGRINVGARGVGLARACLQEALAYAQQRITFGKPIAEHQAVMFRLAEMATKVEASHQMMVKAARLKDAGARNDLEAGMAKYLASEYCAEVVEDSFRIHGGYGYSKEYEIERLYREAPMLLIGEGTADIQRMIIGRRLLEEYALKA